jgi:starch synthase (maltosyl-transferring)
MDRRRAIVEGVQPEIDGGRFPIKRVLGDRVVVEADVYTDGHDAVTARVLWRHEKQRNWREARMEALGNDRFRASFDVETLGRYRYTVEGWVDHFKTWRAGLEKKVAAGHDVEVDLQIGARLITEAASRARGRDAELLQRWATRAVDERVTQDARAVAVLDESLNTLISQYPDLEYATLYEAELEIVVDPVHAQFSAWYEVFPRSLAEKPGAHGTFKDVERHLPYIAEMGFDVLYMPPIHPIGMTKRKGRNNMEYATSTDVGSPWGIGGAAGGHKAVHPELGTMVDFESLVIAVRQHNLDVALDIAFQASPDHPYVKAHPEWFKSRPDGTVQYAENPPKKYQDIYPFDFESPEWASLWEELEDVFRFWIDKGVRIFRVDNPHTKPFPFWEWCITRLKQRHPEVLFLAEAFTTPRRTYRLAKLGFSQSYTYFAWRNTKAEITEYMEELTQGAPAEFFRPNFWPNTPDILTEYLQTGGRPAFMTRVVLAATLASNYGIYGPAYELMENVPVKPKSEEYLHSEKYEIRAWDMDSRDSLRAMIARLNRIRRENPALHDNHTLRFHKIDNAQLIAYSKASGGALVRSQNPYGDELDLPARIARPGSAANNVILTVVNLDFRNTHHGWVELDLAALGLDADAPFEVHDLLSGSRYTWRGPWNYIELSPHAVPAHVFRVTQERTGAED